jgi:hypothetical protein
LIILGHQHFEFAIEVQKGNVDLGETVATDSPILTFCESFFEQFFAATFDYQISGLFDYTAGSTARHSSMLTLLSDCFRHTTTRSAELMMILKN